MPNATLPAAFENALRQVDRALRGRMRTVAGEPAAPLLERLRGELVEQREASLQRGGVDAAWIGATVRWVAEWAPERDVTLVAALGALARLRAGAPEG
jgi:hypothetical protein